ncbi:MAG: shikimate dehydrogenase [Peptostreptococcaceae bacterium]
MKVNSKTKTICLLGHPVAQSFSPSIHNYLFEKYEINNIYTCYDVNPKNLKGAIEGVKSLEMSGCNVTIPHKVNVINYINQVDKNAKLIGAVNTIKNEDGILKGYNTDGRGFVKSILDKGYTVNGKRIMIIGAGGSCRSIGVELASNSAKSIEIRNRSEGKAKEIVDIISENFNTKALYSTSKIEEKNLDYIDILINTTPIGMGNSQCPIDKSIRPHKNLLICDIVYKPHDTEFIKWGNENGNDTIYGIEMLINQGLEAFYIWTGIKPTIEDKNNIMEIYLSSIKEN